MRDNRPVLVTGAFGSLGTRVTRALAGRGQQVVALDLGNPSTRKVAASLTGSLGGSRAGSVVAEWVDITDATAVAALVERVRPRAIVHLAAVIPPQAYARPTLAERVNVDGTRHLADALAAAGGGRFILASSLAVYGSRNGSRELGLATDQTPVNPCEVYGAHKARAERLLHDSSLDWVVLRLGGIIAPDLFTKVDRASVFMQQIIPSDNRIHSIWVDDAATAFVRAVDADVSRRTLLVAGDASHRLRQDEFNGQMFTIAGMGRPTPYGGRPGNPDDDGAWFMTEWMDTEPTFEALDFRPLTMAQTVVVARRELSPLRGLLRPFGALAKAGISMTSPYRRLPGQYADPWRLVAQRYGQDAIAVGQD